MKNNKTIDFVIVNYESFDMAKLLIQSIVKYTTPYKYHIYLVDNSNQEKLFLECNYPNFTYLKGNNNVPQKEFPSQISSAHSHGLQKGLTKGNGEYVCFLDVDTCFLNTWTDHIISYLDKNLFVSHRWEEFRKIARPQFLITKRSYCKQFNIDLSEAYQDSGGIFTKKANDYNLNYVILPNSYNDHSLREHHAVDPGRKIMEDGEQAFIKENNKLKPFFWHFGRGTLLGIKKEWFKLLKNYL